MQGMKFIFKHRDILGRTNLPGIPVHFSLPDIPIMEKSCLVDASNGIPVTYRFVNSSVPIIIW